MLGERNTDKSISTKLNGGTVQFHSTKKSYLSIQKPSIFPHSSNVSAKLSSRVQVISNFSKKTKNKILYSSTDNLYNKNKKTTNPKNGARNLNLFKPKNYPLNSINQDKISLTVSLN